MYLMSIFSGTVLFLIFLAIHIIIWRIFKPQNHISWLFIIFLIFPSIIFTGLLTFSIQTKSINPIEIVSSFLLYIALACVYIQTYPAAQADAPSLKIIYILYKANKGLTTEEIINNFNIDCLVQDRLDDLIIEGYILEENEKFHLRNKGKILSGIFYYYRKLYGLKFGEG